MRKYLLLVLTAICATSASAETLTGRVVAVSDGDTITVLDPANRQHKVRLAQIDAPEKAQGFGMRSKQSLSDLVFNKLVAVDIHDTDRYGRTVGQVRVGGTDANLEQVRRGMALVYRQYAHDPAYFAAERAARQSHVGLWSEPNPTPPWEFRHGSNQEKTLPHLASTTKDAGSKGCGEKRFCKQMTSCEEAMRYLRQCGLSKLDRDGDGVPCESLCAR